MRHWKIHLEVNKFNFQIIFGETTFKRGKRELVKYLRTDKLALEHLPKRFANAFEKAETSDQYDKVLERLYDYADANDIWLGY